ncbi:unnamed protein product [Pleuronectes platessa]|uniref:Uncharacterized protein n=1 Tax=Pleuronectes platessa TaxID=8262 RepID=A0A9N7TR09_PLEPL|nr:unnamed protein product [Pleuronectes platessa]
MGLVRLHPPADKSQARAELPFSVRLSQTPQSSVILPPCSSTARTKGTAGSQPTPGRNPVHGHRPTYAADKTQRSDVKLGGTRGGETTFTFERRRTLKKKWCPQPSTSSLYLSQCSSCVCYARPTGRCITDTTSHLTNLCRSTTTGTLSNSFWGTRCH